MITKTAMMAQMKKDVDMLPLMRITLNLASHLIVPNVHSNSKSLFDSTGFLKLILLIKSLLLHIKFI